MIVIREAAGPELLSSHLWEVIFPLSTDETPGSSRGTTAGVKIPSVKSGQSAPVFVEFELVGAEFAPRKSKA